MDQEPEIYCRYRQGLKDIYSRKDLKKQKIYIEEEHMQMVIWAYGLTGHGKSRSMYKLASLIEPDNNAEKIWVKGEGCTWFPDYYD